MYSKCKWGALAGTLVLLWGCGGSQKSGTPSSGGADSGVTGTCQVSGGVTAELPVKAIAGVDPRGTGDGVFSITSDTSPNASELVAVVFSLKGAAFVVGRTYALSDGGDGTMSIYRHGPSDKPALWGAQMDPQTNQPIGDLSFTLTSIGSSAAEPTHGTLVATLKSLQGDADVTVNCKF